LTTTGIRTAVLVLLQIASATKIFAVPQSKDKLNIIEQEVVILKSFDGTAIADVDLGCLKRGTINKTSIVVTNRLESPVEFNTATVSCSCISARVPKVKVFPEAKERLEFDLAVSENERRTEKNFDVEIRSSGAVDRIILRIKAKISGVIAFEEQNIVLNIDNATMSTDQKLLKKRTPIIFSDVGLLQDAVVSVAEELKGHIQGQVVILDGEAFVEFTMLRIYDERSKSGRLVGEVFLNGPAFTQQTASFTIRQVPIIEIHPNVLVFVSKSDLSVTASAIVRTKKGAVMESTDNVEISCMLQSGEPIRACCKRLSDGIYRVELEVTKSAVEEFRNSSTEISMAFKSSLRDEVLKITSRFVW